MRLALLEPVLVGPLRSPATERAVLLDRDGVLIANRRDYVRDVDDVEILPNAVKALRRVAEAGYAIVIVTNQAVVGKGIIPLAQAIAVHQHVLVRLGVPVSASYLCPHTPADGCPCRKPAPGMLVRAAEDLGIDLRRSHMVGDALTDVLAGRRAATHTCLLLTGRGREQFQLATRSMLDGTTVLSDLAGLPELLP